MLRFRTILFGMAALSVTACGPFDVVTRSAPYESTMPVATVQAPMATSFDTAPEIVTRSVSDLPPAITMPSAILPNDFHVVNIQVEVPYSLRVNDGNALIPRGDIVWHGDLPGDRYAQVQAVMQAGLARGVAGLQGSRDVTLHVVLEKFHSLSQRARYTVGGNHTIRYDLTIYDAHTGQQIGVTHKINSSLDAYGGEAAIIADEQGQTQKVRVIDHIAKVIYSEMTKIEDSMTLASAN